MRVAMPNPEARRPMPAARRFAPRLVPTIAALATIALCVAAGNWQFGRMIEKENLRARYDAAEAAPPLALEALDDATDWNSLRYRTVAADGEYLAAAQILIDNKVHAGRAGYHVVTPLRLRDGAGAAGAVWQHLDPARFAQASGIAVLPIVIEATPAFSATTGPVADWPPHDFGVDKHRIYMVQWYSFAALAFVLWIVLNVRRREKSDE